MSAVFNSTSHHIDLPDIVSGDGVHVADQSGRRFVDLESGVWCLPLGHRHPRIEQVIRTQLDTISHTGFCYTAPIVEHAAQALLDVLGFTNGAVVFLASGSEAIEYARQAASAIARGSGTMSFHDTYLGSYRSTQDRSAWHVVDWERCPDCACGLRDPDCVHLDDAPAGVTELLLELGSSSGLVRFPPKQLVKRCVDFARGRGATIIANEVTTGIGRTGKWFGFDHYDIEPDIVVAGKGLGNGYPVSAVAMSEATATKLANTPFRYSQSHQNDPMGAAVVAEVLSTIQDEGLIETSATKGHLLLDALGRLTDTDAVLDVRGRGLMAAIELHDETVAGHLFASLLERGFIVCPRGTTLRIDPPLIISPELLLEFVAELESILARP